jgi:hypothetical protein
MNEAYLIYWTALCIVTVLYFTTQVVRTFRGK